MHTLLSFAARATVAALTLACGQAALAQNQPVQPAPPEEPETASYSLNTTLKFSTDRKTHGVSDTFNGPGFDLTIDAAHESGVVAQLQLGTFSRVSYPGGNRLNPMFALGWRGGNPEGLHYGVGVAREWFLKAKVTGAPTGFDAQFNPTGVADTRFHTSYLVGELGWGIVTARYLHVVSQDFRGINTSTLCAGYLPAVLAGGDPSAALHCYGTGMQRSRGTHLLDVDAAYPITGDTKLIGHLGYQKVRNFADADLVDYRVGVEHTRWGFVFGAEVAGAKPRNRATFVATNASGTSRALDRSKLILSVAKRF